MTDINGCHTVNEHESALSKNTFIKYTNGLYVSIGNEAPNVGQGDNKATTIEIQNIDETPLCFPDSTSSGLTHIPSLVTTVPDATENIATCGYLNCPTNITANVIANNNNNNNCNSIITNSIISSSSNTSIIGNNNVITNKNNNEINLDTELDKKDTKSLTPDKKVEIAKMIRAVGIEQLKKTKSSEGYCFGASYDTLMSINRDQKKAEFSDLNKYHEHLMKKWRNRGRKSVVQNIHLEYARHFFEERPRGSIKKLVAAIAKDLPNYPVPARTTLNHIILSDPVCISLRKRD